MRECWNIWIPPKRVVTRTTLFWIFRRFTFNYPKSAGEKETSDFRMLLSQIELHKTFSCWILLQNNLFFIFLPNLLHILQPLMLCSQVSKMSTVNSWQHISFGQRYNIALNEIQLHWYLALKTISWADVHIGFTEYQNWYWQSISKV